MAIEVKNPGLLTTIQDGGRSGYYHLGIPPAGAMDQLSFRAANLLVGNDETAAVLECALMGPELVFTEAASLAVTGAQMVPSIDNQPQPTNTVLAVAAGQTVKFGFATGGARGYIAISGGIDVPVVLGSRSTYVLGGLGGLNGRPLAAGDVLALGAATTADRIGVELPPELRTPLGKEYELRMLGGLYGFRVQPHSMKQFVTDTWVVGSEADRVGYRLKGGSPLEFVPRTPPFGAGNDPSNIVDACYPVGSIQVPSGKEPIILHRDAVSGGGYMMIGTVISADMDQIGQMPPNTRVKFVEVTLEQALQARRQRSERLDAIRTELSA